jgi:uncharacterized protein YjdB
MRSHSRATRALVGALLGSVTISCGGADAIAPDDGGTPPTPPTAELLTATVSPKLDSLLVGEMLQMRGAITNQLGQPRDGQLAWRSVDPSIASVSATGLVMALAPGNARVAASSGGRADTALIIIRPAPLTLSVAPATAVVSQGDSVQLSVSIDPTPAEGAVVPAWSSSNASVASVSPEGLVTALGAGDVDIIADVRGVKSKAKLRVISATVASLSISPEMPTVLLGDSVELSAIARDAEGMIMLGRKATWKSSNNSIANVDGTGTLHSKAVGSTRITATVDGISASTDVTIQRVPVASVAVAANASSLTVGQATKLTATLRDDSGNVLEGRVVTWQSSNPGIVVVNASGLATAVGAGTATVRALSEGKVGSASIASAQAEVLAAKVEVEPASASIKVGQTVQLTSSARDASGKAVSGRAATWASSDASVASVSSLGLVTALRAGSVTVSVTVDGKRATSSVTVADTATAVPQTPNPQNPPPPPTVASVAVSLNASSLNVGHFTQATAVVKDAQGKVITGQTIAWSSSAPAVASVTAAGVVEALAAGNTSITATVAGKSGSASLVVASSGGGPVPPGPVSVATVSISPTDTALTTGQTVQSVVTLRDSAGATITGRTVTYASSDAKVATVNASGLVTAVAVGSATITASEPGGKSATLTVSVAAPAPPAVASIVVTLCATSLTVGQSTQATAVARSAAGATIPGVTFTWSVWSGTSVASVSSSGSVTALAAGTASIRATIAGISGTVTLTVTAPAPPPPPASSNTAVAELPRVYLNTAYVPPNGRQIVVKAGDNLQAAINNAQPGDVLLLQPGAVFTGPFTLPKKAGAGPNAWVVIRSGAADAQLPGEGQRVTPSYAAVLPKLVGGAGNATVLTTAPGASFYRLLGVEIALAPGVSTLNSLVRLGDPAANQSGGAEPTDLVLDRVYMHGTASASLTRCVILSSARTAIVDSYLSDAHAVGQDAQAIVGWNGSGPYKIVNNYLEGSGENVMFGGATPTTPGVIPSDIEFRHNHLRKPAAWQATGWLVKNLFELKFARRVLVEGNLLEGNWQDGQTGYAINLKVGASMSWAATEDVTIRYNRIQNTGAGFSLLGADGAYKTTVNKLRRITITDNVLDSVNVGVYKGAGSLVKVLDGVSDLLLDHNTLLSGGGAIGTAMLFDTSPALLNGTVRNNLLLRGQYGVKGSGAAEGANTLNTFVPGGAFGQNVLIGSNSTAYPSGWLFASSLSVAGVASPSDPRLVGGTYRNAGTDGRDIGAAVSAVASATAGVIVP